MLILICANDVFVRMYVYKCSVQDGNDNEGEGEGEYRTYTYVY